jgi:hypothetical protein
VISHWNNHKCKGNQANIPVHELNRTLSPTPCQIVPVAHALAGCDTTFSLFRIGKKIDIQVA